MIEIVDEVMEINQIQNSCQWYELGEKLTEFFLNLKA